MAKAFDLSKFRRGITKSIEGLSIGFNDPTDWISTGNFALNYLISGDFNKGVPLGKVTVFAGESGAGKSFICSGTLIKNAQDQGIFVVLIDSENALDESWLKALGVDTSAEKLLKLNMAMIDDVAKVLSDFVKEYRILAEEDRPKVLFVIDSLGMMLTPTDVNQFEAGEMKGDMGRKPKALTALVRNCVNMFGSLNIGLVATNHTYASQDPYNPDDKISGGCLTAGHKLKLSSGELKNIEDMMIGDAVQTCSGPNVVTKLFSYTDKEVFELSLSDGTVIQATGNHKFMIESASGYIWKSVVELVDGDEIVTKNP
jgi:hypothetical protein